MKILHINNCLNNSGWSKQAEMHLRALDAAGVDVSAKHVDILNNRNDDVHPRVLELLKKDCANPDCIIFNTLPSYYERTGRTKCFGYFVCESTNFINTGWAARCNLMDACFVPCYSNVEAAKRSGVKVPLFTVPEAIDIFRYARDYPPHNIKQVHPDKFLFLTVSEFTQRKNIEAIIRAFHTEFSPSEPVELMIKTTPVGMSNPQTDINAKLEGVKRSLKLYNTLDRYKRENVICGFLSEQDLASLYTSCDAYVNASRAEAFSIPTMDALGFGLPVVSPNHSGLDYLTDKNCFLVDSRSEPCFNALDTLPDLYSAAEGWNEINVHSLMKAMRDVYEKKSLAIKKVQHGRETVKSYSLERVGKLYRETLEKLL